jgi:hypothetical protein
MYMRNHYGVAGSIPAGSRVNEVLIGAAMATGTDRTHKRVDTVRYVYCGIAGQIPAE